CIFSLDCVLGHHHYCDPHSPKGRGIVATVWEGEDWFDSCTMLGITLLCSAILWVHLVSGLAPTIPASEAPVSPTSICGEGIKKETGFMNGLYHVFLRSSRQEADPSSIPLILWLTGGPGCSGLVGLLFENGPCMFNDETKTLSVNSYAWTTIGHVIYVDQPKGTGFSDDKGFSAAEQRMGFWTENAAMSTLAGFLTKFLAQHDDLINNDLYIFGESFAGHFVPDLAQFLLKTNGERWKRTLKGIGIGNGVVSEESLLRTLEAYVLSNPSIAEIMNQSGDNFRLERDRALTMMEECMAPLSLHGRRLRFLRAGDSMCDEAVRVMEMAVSILDVRTHLGLNAYDLRRHCHFEDRVGLCYRFSALEDFINTPRMLEYLGVPNGRWRICNEAAGMKLRQMDKINDSAFAVAYVLEQGVRVLVYSGTEDSVVPWTSSEWWTKHLQWNHQDAFNHADETDLKGSDRVVGSVRSSNGLSLVKVFESGHMVPRDQPSVAATMLFPARVAACFRHDAMNKMQTQVLPRAYTSSGNLLVSAPTGSGKTAVIEAAFLQFYDDSQQKMQARVVYLAPTKSLLQERLETAFRRRISRYQILGAFGGGATKYDSRRYPGCGCSSLHSRKVLVHDPHRQHELNPHVEVGFNHSSTWELRGLNLSPDCCIRFLSLTWNARMSSTVFVALDEAHHIGNASRGFTLEAIIWRMKFLTSKFRCHNCIVPIARLRIVALSATFPNLQDFASWIKCDQENIVNVSFDGSKELVTNSYIDVICSLEATIDHVWLLIISLLTLANDRSKRHSLVTFEDTMISTIRFCSSGWWITEYFIAVDAHGGNCSQLDRYVLDIVHQLSEGKPTIVFCNSRSGAPAHLVIVKSTSIYNGDNGNAEYPASEILQMIGRAGRPGHDSCQEIQHPLRRSERSLLADINETKIRFSVSFPSSKDTAACTIAKSNILIQAGIGRVSVGDPSLAHDMIQCLNEAQRMLKRGQPLYVAYRLYRSIKLLAWEESGGSLHLQQLSGVNASVASALVYVGIPSIRKLRDASVETMNDFVSPLTLTCGELIQQAREIDDFSISTSVKDEVVEVVVRRVGQSRRSPEPSSSTFTLIGWIEEEVVLFETNLTCENGFRTELPRKEDTSTIHIRLLHDQVAGMDSKVDIKENRSSQMGTSRRSAPFMKSKPGQFVSTKNVKCLEIQESPVLKYIKALESHQKQAKQQKSASRSQRIPASDAPLSSTSLCGEQLKKETGFLNDLYYVFYESSRDEADDSTIPVILWLTGGPGCSGLVGALFENGPCMFDDETQTLSYNSFSWTTIGHVIYIDQPRGTGFSEEVPYLPQKPTGSWTEETVVRDLEGFLQEFYNNRPELASNDLYIVGESFAGHYVPDLAQYLLSNNKARWKPILKGIGIGNGVVSTSSILHAYVDFAHSNPYNTDILGDSEASFVKIRDEALQRIDACFKSMKLYGKRERRLRSAGYTDCTSAIELAERAYQVAAAEVSIRNRNMYDIRRECQLDRINLCYRFETFEDFVNNPQVLEYFGVPDQKWSICNDDVITNMRALEEIRDSSYAVAYALHEGVRVLVYSGDADTMVPLAAADWWTSNLEWPHSTEFNAARLHDLTLDEKTFGQVKSSNGLSFVRMFNSGHMVPHDQPEAMAALLRAFMSNDGASYFT
ncbi:TPA: LOW QUALITY PROTEIN: hypothetical protein N0F65_008096, partial [Lagenidium giganteum]